MAYKQKGFPMHSTSSTLKQIVDEPVVTKELVEVEETDKFLENLKKTNPEAYSTKSPDDPTDTLYYIKQDGKWVQTW